MSRPESRLHDYVSLPDPKFAFFRSNATFRPVQRNDRRLAWANSTCP